MIKSYLSPERVHPIGGRVLLEALFAEVQFGPEGEIPFHIPTEHQKRYPSLGRVVNAAYDTGLNRGDLVVLEDEGKDVDHTYYNEFKITLREFEGKPLQLVVDVEVEPILKDTMDAYHRNPTTEDRHISVEDCTTGEWWSFLASDVLHYGFEEMATPAYNLEYIPTFMIDLWDAKARKFKLYYIVHMSKILSILER